jgi:hypothetical protein
MIGANHSNDQVGLFDRNRNCCILKQTGAGMNRTRSIETSGRRRLTVKADLPTCSAKANPLRHVINLMRCYQ